MTGFHALIFSADPAADRAFLRDVLGFPYVDDGEGWLIFKLPPAEIGVHPLRDQPGEDRPFQRFSLMVDDIVATVAGLRAKAATITDPVDHGYGLGAELTLPSGAQLEVYEPRHATAKDLPT
jgi:catechol 2,3-dioxygenase-like lactoylglutathione lyase family enzyme